jgi:hypothetical protein
MPLVMRVNRIDSRIRDRGGTQADPISTTDGRTDRLEEIG